MMKIEMSGKHTVLNHPKRAPREDPKTRENNTWKGISAKWVSTTGKKLQGTGINGAKQKGGIYPPVSTCLLLKHFFWYTTARC